MTFEIGQRVRILPGNPYDQLVEFPTAEEPLFTGMTGTIANVVETVYSDIPQVGVLLDDFRKPVFFPDEGWHMNGRYVEVI